MNNVCLQKLIVLKEIKTICVCGAGTMGNGIAQIAAQAGYGIIQFDINASILQQAKKTISSNLDKLLLKEKITTEEKENTLERIVFTDQFHQCKADVIIEAIVENQQAKTDLFLKVAAYNTQNTIFATNTSSISVNAIVENIPNPERIAGMHFFNPPTIMRLVEIIATKKTNRETLDALIYLSKKLGKVSVVCKDVPGFIVNRVARQYYLEALQLAEQKNIHIETIDAVMESSGFKMGPFRLMDLIGIDINYSVSNFLWTAFNEPERLKPSLLQKQKVEAGELGKKTGKGFYKYNN